jgi:aminoglycoside 6'-N-acetyltransferase I
MQRFHPGIPDHAVDEAVAIFIRAYQEPPWNEQWSPELARLRLDELLEHASCLVSTVYDDGYLAGFAIGTPHTSVVGRSLYLAELVVDPARQRRGFGKALLSFTEENAIRNGYRGIWLVTKRIGSATEFYSKLGFNGSDHLTVLSKRLADGNS